MTHHYILAAQQALTIEQQGIAELIDSIDESFVAAIEILLQARSTIVVMGVGKSGHIARKVAATLSSTGSTAFFVHPTEAAHGDLGVLNQDTIVLVFSNSGNTAELVSLLPHIKRSAHKLIAITANPHSNLARHADVHLTVKVSTEACPLNLAPTASTTAALAMGDAIAVVLLQAKGFKAEDFARSHPGGNLGRNLLLRVADVMRTGKRIPSVQQDASVAEAIIEMTAKEIAMTTVSDAHNKLVGIFTDGDLRRLLAQQTSAQTGVSNWQDIAIKSVMRPLPQSILPQELAGTALKRMEEKRINQLVVIDDDGQLVGALHIHDLTHAKVL